MGLGRYVKKSHLNADQQDIADIIGFENYCALIDVYGGSQIWIPKARSLITNAELATLVKQLKQDGNTIEQIARDLEIPYADVKKYSK